MGEDSETAAAAGSAAGAPAAAVFDCDGLLIDSAACWRLAYERVLAGDGRRLDGELLASLNGASVRAAAAALGVAGEALLAQLCLAFATGPLTALAGAAALLERLRGRLPMAVATNAPRELAELALRRAGLSAHLPIVIGADAMPEKPAPDVYLAACERLGVQPQRAIAFEDSPIGAAAARAAGLRLVYIPSAEAGEVRADLQADRLDDGAVLALFDARFVLQTADRERR
jgi:HAD superfamily hydrolase (TIGR01509 family)